MPKDTLVDARGHMLGRLASVLAKQLLNGEQVVRSCREGPLLLFCPISFHLVHQQQKFPKAVSPAGRRQNRGDLHFWRSHQAEDEV